VRLLDEVVFLRREEEEDSPNHRAYMAERLSAASAGSAGSAGNNKWINLNLWIIQSLFCLSILGNNLSIYPY
jgi:hypothetical protein